MGVSLITACSLFDKGAEKSVSFSKELLGINDNDASSNHIEIEIEERLQNSFEGLFYYEQLNDHEKKVYSEIYYLLYNMKTEGEISSLDENEIEKINLYVLNDHPEIFYADGYKYTSQLLGDKVVSISFEGMYNMDSEMRRKCDEDIENYFFDCKKYVEQTVGNAEDDFNVIKAVYDYLIMTTDYNLNSKYNQGIASVATYHESVCRGYAKMFQYILNRLGIETVVVNGRMKDGNGHAWNLIKSNGDYYYIDPTSGDGSYTFSNDKELGNVSMDVLPEISYLYFLVTGDMLEDYIFDEEDIFPICNSLKDFYFIRNNCYFTDIDDNQIRQAFQNAYAKGEKSITFLMSSDDIYERMRIYMFDKEKLFEYLPDGVTSMSYAVSPDKRYFMFWL